MQWKQRNKNLNSISKIIEFNTGIPIKQFLNPKRDPYIVGLTDAVKLLKECVVKKMPISIIGDYDNDGICASSILKMGIEEYAGYEVKVRLPRRFSEGYGLSLKIIDEIDEGLIVTVDNGIAALEAIAAAKEKGLTVIVIDHHLPVKDADGSVCLPKADIIIDPKALIGGEFNDYCGAGLAYRFVKELSPKSPLLDKLLVMASIATVADVMPLIGDNRNIVKDGLRLINKQKVTTGLGVLLEILNMNNIKEDDYGFKLGPIINASGRLLDDGPMDVLHLLCSDNCDKEVLVEDAKVLISRNEQRKVLVKNALVKAHNYIEEHAIMNERPLIVYEPTCSEGIIGIIAGQLAEEYKCPCIVFTNTHTDGVLKGSGRNGGVVHLKEMLDYAKDELLGYGGHSGAAGMSIHIDHLESLQKKCAEYIKKENIDLDKDKDVIFYDIKTTIHEADDIIAQLDLYAPFGEGNRRPVFLLEDFECTPKDGKFGASLGKTKEHLKLYGRSINAIGFGMYATYIEMNEPRIVDIVGNLSANTFGGVTSNQIEIVDFKAKAKKETEFFSLLAGELDFL